MKNRILKIKAFTLIEMIVVLVITIIVVGLAFSILRLVQKQMWGIEQNYENVTQVNLLRQALWIDFRTYPNITYNEQTNNLHCENGIKTVDYIFENEWIIRGQDTFNLKVDTKTFYFDGLPKQSGQIDAIELLTKKKEGTKNIFVFKENSATAYMN